MGSATYVVQWDVKPGRFEDFMKMASEMKTILGGIEGVGEQELHQLVAGPGPADGSARVTWTIRCASQAALGAWLDNTMASPEYAAVMATAYSADGPGRIAGQVMVNQLDF